MRRLSPRRSARACSCCRHRWPWPSRLPRSRPPAPVRVRGEPAVPEKAGKEIQALYVGDTPPRIDGRLDDEIWLNAQAIDDMVQNDPDNMQPPTERTVVKIAYDNRSVYVAVINYMRDPSKITTALGRRDTFPRSDSIKITFDPRHDHLTAYTFDSNPSGVQGDMTWFDDSRSSTDYDAVWDVRTQIEQGRLDGGVPHSVLAVALHDHAGTAGGVGLQRPPRHCLQRRDDSLGRHAQGRAGIRLALRPRDVCDAAGAAAPLRSAAVRAGAPGTRHRHRFGPGPVRRPRLSHGPRHRDHVVGGDQSRTSARSSRIPRS